MITLIGLFYLTNLALKVACLHQYRCIYTIPINYYAVVRGDLTSATDPVNSGTSQRRWSCLLSYSDGAFLGSQLPYSPPLTFCSVPLPLAETARGLAASYLIHFHPLSAAYFYHQTFQLHPRFARYPHMENADVGSATDSIKVRIQSGGLAQ